MPATHTASAVVSSTTRISFPRTDPLCASDGPRTPPLQDSMRNFRRSLPSLDFPLADRESRAVWPSRITHPPSRPSGELEGRQPSRVCRWPPRTRTATASSSELILRCEPSAAVRETSNRTRWSTVKKLSALPASRPSSSSVTDKHRLRADRGHHAAQRVGIPVRRHRVSAGCPGRALPPISRTSTGRLLMRWPGIRCLNLPSDGSGAEHRDGERLGRPSRFRPVDVARESI